LTALIIVSFRWHRDTYGLSGTISHHSRDAGGQSPPHDAVAD
jgi:hypothetical protein